MEGHEEAKLERFLHWLQANGVELRGCKIKHCDPNKGFGLFSVKDRSDGVLLVVPLDLAITPMRVLQDPCLGPTCRAMFEEGDVDDRFLMTLFLTVERLRKNSTWKPYFDMLPTTFGNPLWFSDDELLELKGTTLHRASYLQKKKLQALFDDKVKHLVKELLLLDGESENEVHFEDFLWANSIFWARALNAPFPRSYVFPGLAGEQETCSCLEKDLKNAATQVSGEILGHGEDEKGCHFCEEKRNGAAATSAVTKVETVWIEGIIPGIDFCNHDLKAAATWEVDETGLTTGVPYSMFLLSAEQTVFETEKEICISYGNKGNEELLYLYGFVIDQNPDDYLMVHYPIEAFQNAPFADAKARLLEIQEAEMRCLLPRSSLDHGLFSISPLQNEDKDKDPIGQFCNYSWSGQRKVPSYVHKLVFPEVFLTALRTIAMQENELLQVSLLLEELDCILFYTILWSWRGMPPWVCAYKPGFCSLSLDTIPTVLVGFGSDKLPSKTEVRAAIWETCGDSGALQLLVDLLHMKMTELEEGSGSEACDTELLEVARIMDIWEENVSETCSDDEKLMSRNRWSSIIYRRGQKQLTRLFLKEAEHALQLCLSEQL